MIPQGTIDTVAGGPEQSDPNTRDPRRVTLSHPSGVVSHGPPGELSIVSSNRHRIYRTHADGTFRLVAGTGKHGLTGDGGPATKASLFLPTAAAIHPDGSLLIADRENHAIRRVDPQGTITTLAGGNGAGFSGDGGLAIEAQLAQPRDVAATPDGQVFIVERGNQCIRRIDQEGTISTVVGPRAGYRPFRRPRGIAVGPDESIYVADRNNDAMKCIRSDGTVEVIAGGGRLGPEGDPQPATTARLDRPSAVLLAPSGDLFIAEHEHHAVRRISREGEISLVAGGNGPGLTGDGGPAHRAQLQWPSGLALDDEGNLYIADRRNHAIRIVYGVSPAV